MDRAAPEFRIDGPVRATRTIVLAHGAGAPMDSPFLETIAVGLAALGLRVVRFEFPYMQARRAHERRLPPDREPVLRRTWEAVVEALGGGAGLVIGGKSLGGRVASLIADDVGARGLVCLGYPFHPAGRPERTRTAHLEGIRTPTLIVQGTRDPLGRRHEVQGYRLSQRIRVVWLEDGDHSFAPRRRSGRCQGQNLREAIAAVAQFLTSLEPPGGGDLSRAARSAPRPGRRDRSRTRRSSRSG